MTEQGPVRGAGVKRPRYEVGEVEEDGGEEVEEDDQDPGQDDMEEEDAEVDEGEGEEEEEEEGEERVGEEAEEAATHKPLRNRAQASGCSGDGRSGYSNSFATNLRPRTRSSSHVAGTDDGAGGATAIAGPGRRGGGSGAQAGNVDAAGGAQPKGPFRLKVGNHGILANKEAFAAAFPEAATAVMRGEGSRQVTLRCKVGNVETQHTVRLTRGNCVAGVCYGLRACSTRSLLDVLRLKVGDYLWLSICEGGRVVAEPERELDGHIVVFSENTLKRGYIAVPLSCMEEILGPIAAREAGQVIPVQLLVPPGAAASDIWGRLKGYNAKVYPGWAIYGFGSWLRRHGAGPGDVLQLKPVWEPAAESLLALAAAAAAAAAAVPATGGPARSRDMVAVENRRLHRNGSYRAQRDQHQEHLQEQGYQEASPAGRRHRPLGAALKAIQVRWLRAGEILGGLQGGAGGAHQAAATGIFTAGVTTPHLMPSQQAAASAAAQLELAARDEAAPAGSSSSESQSSLGTQQTLGADTQAPPPHAAEPLPAPQSRHMQQMHVKSEVHHPQEPLGAMYPSVASKAAAATGVPTSAAASELLSSGHMQPARRHDRHGMSRAGPKAAAAGSLVDDAQLVAADEHGDPGGPAGAPGVDASGGGPPASNQDLVQSINDSEQNQKPSQQPISPPQQLLLELPQQPQQLPFQQSQKPLLLQPHCQLHVAQMVSGSAGLPASHTTLLPSAAGVASVCCLHGCVPPGTSPSPLQPGAVRLCGVTYAASLGMGRVLEEWETTHTELRRWMAAEYQMEVRLPYKAGSSRPAGPPSGHGSGAILSAGSGGRGFAVPAPPCWIAAFRRYRLDAFAICYDLSARLGLVEDPAAPLPEGPIEPQQGVEIRQDPDRPGEVGLFATQLIPANGVIYVMSGYVMPQKPEGADFWHQGYESLRHDVRQQLQQRMAACGVKDERLFWRLLAGAFRVTFPGHEDCQAAACEGLPPLELQMLGHGGMAAYMNDPRVNAWEVKDEEDPQADGEGANCLVVPVYVRGVPLPVVVALRDIQPGEQLLRDYGAEWWCAQSGLGRVLTKSLKVSLAAVLHEPGDWEKFPPSGGGPSASGALHCLLQPPPQEDQRARTINQQQQQQHEEYGRPGGHHSRRNGYRHEHRRRSRRSRSYDRSCDRSRSCSSGRGRSHSRECSRSRSPGYRSRLRHLQHRHSRRHHNDRDHSRSHSPDGHWRSDARKGRRRSEHRSSGGPLLPIAVE